MARSLRKEIDSLMRAELEQTEDWHEAMSDPSKGDDPMALGRALNVLYSVAGVQRKAILRIAEEIDRLGAAEDQDS